jgi:hypothetical protein
MSRDDIIQEHDNQRDAWPAFSRARASGRKTLRHMAIIEGLNHSLDQGIIESDAKPILSIPRDYKEITLFRQ